MSGFFGNYSGFCFFGSLNLRKLLLITNQRMTNSDVIYG